MDILSLAIGVIIGGLAASGLLGHHLKTRLKRREAELLLARREVNEARKAEQLHHREAQHARGKFEAAEEASAEMVEALEADKATSIEKLKAARTDHRKTKRHLKKATTEAEAANQRATAVQKDLAGATGKLVSEREAHKQAKKHISELQSEIASTNNRAHTLEADLKRARSASTRAAPTNLASAEEVEELHQEIDALTTRIGSSEAAKVSAEEARARVEEQLQQALADAYTAREEDSARLGEIQTRLSRQDAVVNRLRAELAWAQVAAEVAESYGKACDTSSAGAPVACQWGDDPNQEKLATMILDAAVYKSSGGENGEPLSIRNVMALSDRFGWNNKEAASRITHAVSKIKSTVDDDTFRAVEAEAEQFYFTYTA